MPPKQCSSRYRHSNSASVSLSVRLTEFFIYNRHILLYHRQNASTKRKWLIRVRRSESSRRQRSTLFVTLFFMAALCNKRRPYIFSSCGFFFFLLFSLPNLSGRRLDVYHTSTHGVALIITRWLYCVECPQYSTRRRSASNVHRSDTLRKNR